MVEVHRPGPGGRCPPAARAPGAAGRGGRRRLRRAAALALAGGLLAPAAPATADDDAPPASSTGAAAGAVREGEAAAQGVSPLDEGAARAALAALEGPDADAARAAIERIVAAGDRRFAPVFVELIRASEVGIAAEGVRPESAVALRRLTGEALGWDWTAWMEWLEAHDTGTPPGFVSWKGRLLGRIDPAFRRLLRDRHPRRVRAEEIVWGGVAYEGIPALDRPATVAAGDADWLDPDEPVFGVVLGGEARAYPLRILDWHELVNDAVGGVPFALTWCTLCGSGIAYDARVPDVGTLDFGTSGLLLRSNKLMVDRRTRTLWTQLTGRPVLGPLAERDLALEVLPSVVARWRDWRARHPDTRVLSLDTGHERPYEPGAAYAGYNASPDTMFPVRRARDELPAKARVFGLVRDGVARAWPLARLVEEGVVNDRVAGRPVVLVASGPRIEVDGVGVRSGPARYEAGAEVRAYRRGDRVFRPDPEAGGAAVRDAADGRWEVREEALVGPGGERLPRLPGVLAWWFGWTAFHPGTELGAALADRELEPL